MKATVIKYSSGDYIVYADAKCFSTDKAGAIKRATDLTLRGYSISFKYEEYQVSPIGFFDEPNKLKPLSQLAGFKKTQLK